MNGDATLIAVVPLLNFEAFDARSALYVKLIIMVRKTLELSPELYGQFVNDRYKKAKNQMGCSR